MALQEPGALPTGPWVTAFKELEGKEARSLEDFVAVFDVCKNERRYAHIHYQRSTAVVYTSPESMSFFSSCISM